MSFLTPIHANAVIFYGQEACNRFGQLIQYWNAILEPAGWDRFVFVLVADAPAPPDNLPEELNETISRNSYTLSTQETVCPGNIVHAVKEKLAGRKVLLHCVCADFDRQQVTPENPVRLMQSLTDSFPAGSNSIFYLMLGEDPQALNAQHLLLKTLVTMTPDNMSAYPYLVSRLASDGSAVGENQQWRAVFLEILANSAGRRNLLDGKMYSLGYSVLNADDRELCNLRRQKMRDVVEENSQKEIIMSKAWELLTQGKANPDVFSASVAQQSVNDWVSRLVKEKAVFPGEKEKNNNRILSRANQLNSTAMQHAFELFFQLNVSLSGWRDFGKQYLDTLKNSLCKFANAAAFPVSLVEGVMEHLRKIEVPRQARYPLPQKRLLMTPAAYRRVCWETIEVKCEEEFRGKHASACAGSLLEALKDFLIFIDKIKTSGNRLDLPGLTSLQHRYLTEKYPKYWKDICDISFLKGENLFSWDWFNRLSPFYDFDGKDMTPNWHSLIDDGEKILQKELSEEFSGSFCRAINAECATNEELISFFDRHLRASTRMLFNIQDAAASVASLFFADREFENHPWITHRQDQSVIVRNDNVERVDLYLLEHGMDWYLNGESLYFGAGLQQEENDYKAGMLMGTIPERPLTPGQNMVDMTEQSAVDDNILTHGINLRMSDSGNEYILSWDWKPGTMTAKIQIWQDNRLLHTIPCHNAEFIAHQGILVTQVIPYGKVSVCIYSHGVLYAKKNLSGRKNKVHYRIETAKNGSCDLFLNGSPEDISKLVLVAARSQNARPVYYPLNPLPQSEVQRYGGIYLPLRSQTQIRPYPGDEFPEVEAIKGNA